MTRQPRIALLGALACLVALVAVAAVAYLAPFGRWLDDATLMGFVDLHSRGSTGSPPGSSGWPTHSPSSSRAQRSSRWRWPAHAPGRRPSSRSSSSGRT